MAQSKSRESVAGATSVREKFYAYVVTDVTGNQVGKTKPGQHLLEREYKGNGEYTWVIFDFGKKDAPVTATLTGTYVGIVYGESGRLTDESREMLSAFTPDRASARDVSKVSS